VVFIHPDTGKPTSSVPEEGQILDEKFDQIERWLDQNVAIGAHVEDDAEPGTRKRRDMSALGDLYLDWLAGKGCDPDYIAKRKSLLNVWVRPVIGELLVTNWDSHASLKVIDNARPHLSAARLQDLGSTLSGLRATAHRRRAGGRWLSPDEDPLEEVSYTKGSGKQGASSKWVPEHKRPETEMVEKAINAAEEFGRWEWLPDAIRTGGFCAARLSEQLGLRAIDVDLRKRELDVNGVWETPPSGKAGRPGQGPRGPAQAAPEEPQAPHHALRRLDARDVPPARRARLRDDRGHRHRGARRAGRRGARAARRADRHRGLAGRRGPGDRGAVALPG
jgi:hypothetical protein